MLQVQYEIFLWDTKVQCMKDYIKPSLRETTNLIIINVGTNDVSDQNKSQESITESIVNLTTDIKNQSHHVTISSIAVRKDKWNKKVDEVNNILKKLGFKSTNR